ncbi:RpiR family transcriptional regulator [Entomoplasma freundtii]|uniref:Uncharacterized protein n=2 Tax=Entomoplasma freundtii TaxID=74700 RepID=A0A2K8NR16_9MOLU|nr:hypothetical protein [Entomoplasma freundtii]ATZ16259.1 hypothetical protein EFREU_v1c02320 [Entomoplasma freundtii]TDY56840.1 RpiR family transcriptional regulator [Entomoplasma freundtii]
MFQSIKEKLTFISNNLENPTYAEIANYLLNCLEKKQTPTSKKCADQVHCAESVLTAFAKKYGYNGFKELVIRLKVESEYYDFSQRHSINPDQKNHLKTNYRHLIDESLDLIDQQVSKMTNLINDIHEKNKIYAISCYQQLFNTELFISELQLLGYEAFINLQRKTNAIWLRNLTENDICLIVAFGLDNQYVVNYYQLATMKTKNIYVFCSPSQRHKFPVYKEKIIVDYSKRSSILETTRSTLVNYLFSQIVYNL